MIISNKLSNEERHYIQNLVTSGNGEIPDESGKVSNKATHVLLVEKGFITGARKIIRKEETK